MSKINYQKSSTNPHSSRIQHHQ